MTEPPHASPAPNSAALPPTGDQPTLEISPFAQQIRQLAQQVQALVQAQDYGAAARHCRQVIHQFPRAPEPYALLAEVFHGGGHLRAAVNAYHRTLALISDPERCVPVWIRLSAAYCDLEDWHNAGLTYKQAMENSRQRAPMFLRLAWIAAKAGSAGAAIANLAVLHQQRMDLLVPDLVAPIGTALAELEPPDLRFAAIQTCLRTLQQEPRMLFAYDLLQGAMLALGREHDAKECRERAVPRKLVEDFCPEVQLQVITARPPGSEALDLAPDVAAAPGRDPSDGSTPAAVVLEGVPGDQTPTPWSLHPDLHVEVLRTGAQRETHHFSAPKTCHAELHPDLQPQSSRDLETYVVAVDQGRVWGDWFTSAVMTADGALVNDISGYSHALVASSQELPPPVEIDGRVAFLSLAGGTNYFHWMLDMLPRVHLLRQSPFREVDYYVVYGRSLKFQAQTLERLGIHESQIITSETDPHLRARQIVVPSTIRKYRVWATPRWACEFLRDALMPEGNGGREDWPERIYVSRRGATCRRITNEAEVERILGDRGFCTVRPGDLDLDLQIQVMRHAKVVVAPHGAALTNLVFCQPGTKVLEIFPPDSLPGFFWAISHHMHLDYYYATGTPFDPEHFDEHQIGSLNPNHDDIFVPPDVLTGLLDLAGVD